MDTYRVFISYSHKDRELAEKIVAVLKENGLDTLWDQNFAFGHGFPEQIRNFIAHAHVFMPILTTESSERGWVHQEIGFAMALNVPVLPVSKDQLPDAMLQHLHAISLSDKPEILKEQLSKEIFTQIVRRAQRTAMPLYECGELHEERTMMMVEYATGVLELGVRDQVRQKGALSSFHIPDKPIYHPIWRERYGNQRVSEFSCRWLRQERQALEEHAQEKGCRLIIDPYLGFERHGPRARKVRLETLKDFLESARVKQVVVAIHKGMEKGRNLTIVGDWFAAEAVSAELGKGYRQTIFTRHGPTVRSRIEIFEQELQDLLASQNLTPESSRGATIEILNQILAEVDEQIKKEQDQKST